MNRRTLRSAALVAAVMGAAVLGGCRDCMPHAFTVGPGMVGRTHAKPAEGGYYTNWDPYAASVEVLPVEATNPVGTQHVLVATVRDKDGQPLPNRRVEWIIPDGGVGAFVEVDESGLRDSRGHKVTNRLAISHTNNYDHVLTRGNHDPEDDVKLKKGQTWCVITSPVEGTTHVIAYVPGIHDWSKHKVFVKKHWYDVAVAFPPEATNPIGTQHRFVTKVTKHSDGKPLADYHVTYKILSGPAATLLPGDKATATVKTDANGLATVTLKQAKPVEGVNEIHIDVIRPANEKCCRPAVHMATGRSRKTWIGPKIAIAKTAPAKALVGQRFNYSIVVSNPSKVAAPQVAVTDELPDGIKYVASSPQAKAAGQKLTWSLGTLPAGGKSVIRVTVEATRTGRFNNCADVKAAYGLSARSCAPTVVAQAALALTKTAPAEVLICETIPYTFTVRNTGDAPATNVKFTDQLPEGLLWQGQHKSLQADVGTLAAGESKQVKFVVKATKPGTYNNTAQVAADHGLTAKASAKTVVRQPVLVLTKKGPKNRYVGRPATFTIKVANKGDGPARNTVLTDVIPANAKFVSASGGGTAAGDKVSWNLGTLAPGASSEVTITLKVTTQGQVRNTATVTALCAKTSDEAVVDVKGIPAILLECVDVEDPIEVGAKETYVITVTNQGSADGTNIVVACTLPPAEEFLSAQGPTKETVKGKQVTFAPLKSLAPKAKAVYRVVVKGTQTGDVRFKVSLTSDQMTSPAEETESTHIYSD